ncbi:HNH endonuclease signature motif containing protein [Amycolatopsis sp. H20-H5]|uniref:HNH endonuclease signature motif containing protein n=1 Tax=Amycolatopsis sp. H20-H5 TaxID=3046309 RepID=UPI002DB7D909|nr:DUF222 domain-containing protein [Amycolatopsis sp. H20-H5]MEC3977333.1 DUF222 domain-containing protein [Amycolatopsis sp. H20-H5]
MRTAEMMPVWQLSDEELLAGLLAADQDFSRQYAHILDFVAEVEKRDLGVEKGYRSTAMLLELTLRVSRKEAKARVAQATAVLPLVRKALESGEINREHAHEIEHVLSQAPDSVSDEDLQVGEAALVELSQQAIPSVVRRVGRRMLAYWDLEDKDPGDRERKLSEPVREFRYRFLSDGRMKYTGVFDAEFAQFVESLLIPLAKPNPVDEFGNPDPRTLEQRNGDAVAAVFDLAGRAPDLPVKAGERAVVTVTIGLDELERRAGTAMLDGYGAVSASQLRRMCCDARVVPAVLNGAGEVLDLGRAVRTASPAQRRALIIRDRGCTGPGCSRGPKWCIPHHLTYWTNPHGPGGPTDIVNLGLTCERCHHLLHHGGWDMRLRNGTIEWLPPAWLDPERRPIRNTAHDPPSKSSTVS